MTFPLARLTATAVALSASLYSVMAVAASSNFYGESAADEILKNDVLKFIQPSISILYGDQCKKIDRIDSQIISVNQNEQGELKEVIENWTVTSCNMSKIYRISLRPDAKGEVDFTVRIPTK